MFKTIILLVSVVFYVNCAKLPPFITACGKNDHACALASAQKAIPEMFKGYKPFKIRPLNPFKYEKLDLSKGDGLKIQLLNGEALISAFTLTEANVNSDTNKWHFKATYDVVGDSDYEVSGKLMIIPVEGKGKCRIEMDKVEIEYSVNLKVVERDGKEYYEIESDETTAKMAAVRMRFDNLFNGDKVLGDNVNLFINENWREVEQEFHPGFVGLITAMIQEAVKPFLKNVPIEEIII